MVHFLTLREIDPVERRFVRRHAAADPKLETACAHLIEHADFLDQSDGMIERQEIYQRAKAQALRPLGDGRKKNARGSCDAEGRRMTFGQMIGVDAGPVIGLDQPQPIFVMLAEWQPGMIEVIKYSEFHQLPPSQPSWRRR